MLRQDPDGSGPCIPKLDSFSQGVLQDSVELCHDTKKRSEGRAYSVLGNEREEREAIGRYQRAAHGLNQTMKLLG